MKVPERERDGMGPGDANFGRNWRGVQSHVVRLNVAEGPLQNSRRRRLVAWPPAERHPTRR